MPEAGVLERLCGQLAGQFIVWTAKLAHRRGDIHTFRHLRAAIQAGNTGRGHLLPCRYETDDVAAPGREGQ